jgi:hypothetical protein
MSTDPRTEAFEAWLETDKADSEIALPGEGPVSRVARVAFLAGYDYGRDAALSRAEELERALDAGSHRPAPTGLTGSLPDLLAKHGVLITYGFSKTDIGGCVSGYSFGPFPLAEGRAHYGAVYEGALAAGWTPPRWWEFWRWRDQPRGPHEPLGDGDAKLSSTLDPSEQRHDHKEDPDRGAAER